jgi:uridine kinase
LTTPIIIGIAGGTASGKTTIARRVAEDLGDRCVLLPHDAYYRPLPASFRGREHAWNFDEPAALDTDLLIEHVGQLRAGQPVAVPRYDFARHDRIGAYPVEPRAIVLVEGILVLADPALRAVLDHRVFVHAPEPVRLGRRIRRDAAERGRDMDDVLGQYFATVRPMHDLWVEPSRAWATAELDGAGDVDESVRALMALLR